MISRVFVSLLSIFVASAVMAQTMPDPAVVTPMDQDGFDPAALSDAELLDLLAQIEARRAAPPGGLGCLGPIPRLPCQRDMVLFRPPPPTGGTGDFGAIGMPLWPLASGLGTQIMVSASCR